jgi:hypothetical protein
MGSLRHELGPVEIIAQSHTNCMDDTPALHNGTYIFVYQISYVIKVAGLPVHCNEVVPPCYKL